jgi:hypothetical protein
MWTLNWSYDRRGRLVAHDVAITRGMIASYAGCEVPNWRALRLDPWDRLRVLRSPRELQRAAFTFEDIPILSHHIQCDDPDRELSRPRQPKPAWFGSD